MLGRQFQSGGVVGSQLIREDKWFNMALHSKCLQLADC